MKFFLVKSLALSVSLNAGALNGYVSLQPNFL